MISRICSVIALCAITCLGLVRTADAQPLANPYPFWFSDTTSINNSLALQQNVGKAGSKGRVVLRDGHLGFADGSRLRIAGTTLQWFSAFPDSARAVQLARRLRDLGVNCVRFNSFDVNVWPTVSIFDAAETRTLGAGLSETQMQKFDWLVHQLREHGVYYVFSFQSMWTPKPGDGVIQPDSTGWGARVPLIFNPVIQQIQRNIVRAMLEHRNQYTGIAYKDDPALAFMIAAEDAPLSAYWLYTQDIVRPNTQGQASSGSLHVRLIDSLWQNWLQQRYGTDQQLSSAWSTASRNTANMLTNGDFEDPFSTVWQFFVNTNDGAQAILQFSDADKREGTTSARIRINTLDRSKVVYSLNLNQKIPVMRRLQTYQFSFWAKTTPQRASRSMLLYIYNGTSPYNSYGLQTEVRLSSTWQKYDFTFTSTATDSTTAYVGFLMGADSGDVFLDDVQFKEVAVAGLQPGESLQERNIPLSPMLDASVTPARAAANAAFLHERLSSMFSHMRKLVRDTLRSEVLMCPSTRFVSYYDMTTASDYEVFSNTEWRGGSSSMLTELYGGTMTSHAQVRPEGKAFVVAHLAYQFPRPYQSEMMTVIPAYNGLQDWDGIFFSVFSENMLAGATRIDSNNYWVLQNKPNVLSMFPWTSSLIRSAAVAPSAKSITITHTPESRELPSQHVQNNYSLRISPDSRMPLFRRIAVNLAPGSEEAFQPHLEISALSGEVDLAALDAENEQIFWDATKGQMRIQTPTHVALMGRLEGQIVTADMLTAEQTTPGLHAVVAMHSLTSEPLVLSNENMLTISTRALNEGAVFTADNSDLAQWGRGNIQMEGVSMRVTITSPQFDSLTIIPLSQSGQPVPGAQPIGVVRRAGNKFTTMIDTKVHATPWFKLVYGLTTSVTEEAEQRGVAVLSQPVYDGILRMHLPNDAQVRGIVDMQGQTLMSGITFGRFVDVSSLVSGVYFVLVELRGGQMSSLPFIIHEK
jgi:hypothetical protein